MSRKQVSSERIRHLSLILAPIGLSVAGAISIAVGVQAAHPTSDTGQIDAGYHADVTDLKTTVSYSTVSDRTDISLDLVPAVPSGGPGVSLVFTARFRGRTVDVSRLDDLAVRAHYALHSDDRARAVGALTTSLALRLNIDPQDPGGIQLDFFPASWGYPGFAAPGDEIPVAFFSITPADLRALSLATAITGDVLWTPFTFTADEVIALRTFARTVLPPVRPTT